MTDGRNALTWGMFEPDPRNVLNASEPTQADAYSYNAPVVRDAWAAAQDPQTWQDAAQQYGQALLAGSVAPGAKGMALDPAALQVLREMTPGFRAYHGSPHSFDAFDSAKIGTGEGAQAYGYGLYLADREGVARSYRDALSNRISGVHVDDVPVEQSDLSAHAKNYAQLFGREHMDPAKVRADAERSLSGAESILQMYPESQVGLANQSMAKAQLAAMDELNGRSLRYVPHTGSMYEVQVNADPAHFLDWDKPLSEQSPHVQQALAGHGLDPAITGSAAYQTLAERAAKPSSEPAGWGSVSGGPGRYDGQVHDPAAATTALRAAGIPGIRYLDGGSRADGTGTSNHVIFDANTLSILRKYGIAGLMMGGAAGASGASSSPAPNSGAAP